MIRRIGHAPRVAAVAVTVTVCLAVSDVVRAQGGATAPAVPTAADARASAIEAAVLGRMMTLRLKGVLIKDALAAIAEQAGVRLQYNAGLLPEHKLVSLVADRITVGDALAAVLEGTGLETVVPAPGRIRLEPGGEATGGSARRERHQGGQTVEGRVVDAVTRAPLDQVAVRVEGPGVGAVTSSDGRYRMRNVSPGTYRVTARRVGYTPLTKTVTIVLDSSATADFVLSVAPTKLNEVVTTAVGDQRRYEVGNTISTINADSIAPTAPITSLTDLLSARAPGVQVEEASGLTGAGEAIRIRGQSSLVLQGDPIVIVDGVRQDNTPGGTATLPFVGGSYGYVPAPSRLNDLAFADIQSIDVLKGPAASTEYGTDAANGVIVITTKHGTAGRPQWQASAEETASQIPERFPALYYSWGHTTDPSHTPVNCPLVPFAFGSGYGSASGTCAVDSVTTWDPLNTSSYSIFGTGHRQKYDLSVGGGSEVVQYFVSLGLSNEIGALRMPSAFIPQADAINLPHSAFNPNGENQRSVRATTTTRVSSAADLSVTGAYTATYSKTPNAQGLFLGVFVSPARRDSANGYGYGSTFNNPVYQFGQPASQSTQRLTGGVTATWRPFAWFLGHGTVGIDHGSDHATNAVLPQVVSLYPFIAAQLGVASTTHDIYTFDVRGSATAVVGHVGRSVTSIGLQLADTRLQGTTATAIGVTATNFTLNGSVNPLVTQLGNRQATLGGYGEEQFGLWDRLFLTGALRVDAGSGFGNAYSTAVYPKASVSWLALDNGPTTLRVRGAFGESGVQPPNGAALELYAPAVVGLNGGVASGTTIANVQDQRVHPERSEEYEAGADLGFWRSRLNLEFTGYSKITHGALVSTGTGWDAGALPYVENVGEVRNEGVEGTLSATMLASHALTWDVSLNASINRNTLLALAPGIVSQQLAGVSAVYRFAAHYPLYGYWGTPVQYSDLNHDGMLNLSEVTVADSLAYAGASLPTREVSLGTHVGLWGGAVTVGGLFDYRGDFRLMKSTAFFQSFFSQNDLASNKRTAPLWQQARDVAAELITVTGVNGYAPPRGFYEDGTYLRFRELSITYVLPRRLVEMLRARTLSVTGAVRNLALWTRYTGVDPEVTNSEGANVQLSPTSNTYLVNNNMREDTGAVPLLRYWVVRVNAGL